MASMIALLGDVEDLEVGRVVPIDRYVSDDRALWRLGHGGTLYLVAPGPNHAVLLVAALEQPERSRIFKGDQRPDGWYAPPNTVPVTDISQLRKRLNLGAKTKLVETLANAIVVEPAAESQLRALFDDEDEPVIVAREQESARVAQIEELLVIWRRTRSSAVADVIDRATHLLPRFDRPLLLDVRDDHGSHARWMQTWHEERAEAMPQLLRNFMAMRTAYMERYDLLAAAPDDPRITRALARHVLAGSLSWGPIVERSREAFAWTEIAGVLRELDEERKPGIRAAFAFAQHRPATTPLTAAEAERVAAIDAMLVPDTAEAALVDAIAEHPGEDDPYLVYSDWLLERGHPRGEYIALACQKQHGKLSSALARRLAMLEKVPYLFGALDDVATTWQRPRPRGVDRTLDVYGSTTNLAWREVARHPLARALEALRFVGYLATQRIPGIVALVRAAPRLRRLDEIDPPVGNELVKVLGPAWRRHDGSVVRV